MHVLLITYDLKRPVQNYDRLFAAIKALGAWWHYLDSAWLVATTLSVEQASNRIRSEVDTNDRVLVMKVCRPADGWLTQEAWNWINQNVTVC